MKTIALDQIDPLALPRDRSGLDETALEELVHSIARSGLRMPLEIYPIDGPKPWGLLSGFRRYHALERIGITEAQALIREPQTTADAIAIMVEENETRAAISAWEKGRIALIAWQEEHFETLDAAVKGLFPFATRQKRGRIRAVAEVVYELDGVFTKPETFTEHQLLRLETAIRHDWTDLITTALSQAEPKTPAEEWKAILPVIQEVEEVRGPSSPPRRLVRLPRGLVVRRERTKTGFSLHLSGPQATISLAEEVLDRIEYWLSPGD